MKIFFYVDSFGLGHITRQVALIRAIGTRANIIILSSGHLDFIKKSLPQARVEKILPTLNFVPSGLGLNFEKTHMANRNLSEHFSSNVRTEIQRLEKEKPDLIVADIPAEIFVAADAVGIPIIAISNFGWTIILEHIFGKSSDFYSLYSHAYSKSSKTFVLPFSEPMSCFSKKEKIGLLRRHPTINMQKKIGIVSAFGYSIESQQTKSKFFSIPKTETESQNFISAASAIFAKPSYGIISESIPYGIPLFFKLRKNFPESDYLLKSLNCAETVPDDVEPFDWITQRLPELNFEKIQEMAEKYSSNSDIYLANSILSFPSV
ncbi:MAG: hypothetical protein ABID61_01430 [Candidatus Micrarchaeota archaeon]